MDTRPSAPNPAAVSFCRRRPTMLVGDHVGIAWEEVFGPVLAVFCFSGVDEVVRRAKSSRCGLSAMEWTKDASTVHAIAVTTRRSGCLAGTDGS